MTTPTKERVQTCRSHCRGCNRCFSGDESFARHRVGRHDVPEDHPDARRCLEVDEEPDIFEGIIGECRNANPPEVRATTVWRQAGTAERMTAWRGDR